MAVIFAHTCGDCGERLLTDPKAKRYDHADAIAKDRRYDHDVTRVVSVTVATNV